MENNIFEGAKFGDKFITYGAEPIESSRIAIFWQEIEAVMNPSEKVFSLVLEGEDEPFYYTEDGRYVRFDSEGYIQPYAVYDDEEEDEQHYVYDIVSRYQEPIDEDKLNKLAYETYSEEYIEIPYHDYVDSAILRMGFKEGYRKALKV